MEGPKGCVGVTFGTKKAQNNHMKYNHKDSVRCLYVTFARKTHLSLKGICKSILWVASQTPIGKKSSVMLKDATKGVSTCQKS